ncbi:MAG: hypothetical protein IPM39_21835 [Chloroflexi bacterium]|nr:hypothetical protein [Chloroflexota bacterium]
MSKKHWLIFVILAIALATVTAFADDGQMFRRNISKTPDQETERANLNHMAFYVPAQTSDGVITSTLYYDAAGTLVDTRDNAKPLVAVYIDSLPEEEEGVEGIYSILSGAGFGAHDAYAALSLDDGATWKRTNLSLSADLSSFTLANGHPYPGDAHNMTFTIAGDKVLVGWISKYCDGGSPMYTFVNEDVLDLQEDFGLPDLYVRDIWGVAGSQNSVDYTGMGFPEVGEIPYSCVWSARGQLLPVELDDASMGYDIVWTKAERLTSGRRDANRLEMAGDSAGGFMMTWQEDPEGLRPGQGLGPGEGWSGAVVNQQTDLWYSFVSLDDFVMVMSDDSDDAIPIDIAAYAGETMPKVAVPMAMPIRLTDNKMCKALGSDPYCYVEFDDTDPYGATVLPDVNWDDPNAVKTGITQSENSTYCTIPVSWTNPGGTTLQLCQTEDGRVLQGRVGSSRPRVNVQPYDSLYFEPVESTIVYDSAIVIMGAEESKALGEGSTDDDAEPEDIGKNMWYYSFDMLNPEFLLQGGMLNQPAVCGPHDEDCIPGEFFPMMEDDFGNDFYETEISRRFSHMSQPIHQIGQSGVSSVLIVKQGILNQGGPADIFLRMTKVPDGIWVLCDTDNDPTTIERCLPEGYNPYAYENLVCDEWVYTDGSNPRYLEGLCLSNMINVSGTSIVSCDNGTSGDDCAAAFPWDGGVTPFPKVTEWRQCGGASTLGGYTCNDNDLDDQSWENPYDVAKGHRGFIDGDFIMMMYAWSPNWQANSVGNDHYNLYARRSFDGGLTWTTTPAALGGEGEEDATDPTACENYGAGSDYTRVCFDYAAGAFEQSRNLSQLTGNRVTILDPRYTPTGGLKMLPITDLKGIGFTGYEDDVRDPSKFFIVYETGDNTTVADGEAVPLDLFYSRATTYGDDYFLVEYANAGTGEITMGFDWLEHDREDLSGEAANTCNNGGTYYYVIWNQWQEDELENVSNSDAIFRRVMFLNEDTAANTPPYVSILYTSHTAADYSAGDLTFIGSARPLGSAQIAAYEWRSDLDGLLSNQKSFTIPVTDLSLGNHMISFRAQDNHGRWSNEVTTALFVGYRTFLPVTTNQ